MYNIIDITLSTLAIKKALFDRFEFDNFNFGIGTSRFVSVCLGVALFRDLLFKQNKVLNVKL